MPSPATVFSDRKPHRAEVTASSLFEAVAQGLSALRKNEWVEGIEEQFGIVKVSVAEVRVNCAELYTPDPNGPGTFTQTVSLKIGRFFHTATVQTNGTVLFAGGQVDGNGTPTADAEVYVYDLLHGTGTFAAAAPLNAARHGHTATFLEDGRVLVTGGVVSSVIPAPDTSTLSVTPTVELYPKAP